MVQLPLSLGARGEEEEEEQWDFSLFFSGEKQMKIIN